MKQGTEHRAQGTDRNVVEIQPEASGAHGTWHMAQSTEHSMVKRYFRA